jgi:uncharacterized protein (TIGR02284 family)
MPPAQPAAGRTRAPEQRARLDPRPPGDDSAARGTSGASIAAREVVIMDRDKVIDQLNSFLRGEISAVETYRQAVSKVTSIAARSEVTDCLRSHEERVMKLSNYIRQLGGTPETSSKVWGAFAKLVQGGANALGERAAIAALEEGEDHGIKDYQADLSDLDIDSRQFVEMELMRPQQQTHRVMSDLKHALSASKDIDEPRTIP